MVNDPKITERDGKQYCTLPNGNQVELENEIINNPGWIDVEGAIKIIGVGDRQIRNLAEKNSWDKKYAYINKKPVTYYQKSQLENFQRNRVTEVMPSSVTPEETQHKEGAPSLETIVGQNLISKETINDIDHVVKKLEPYIGDFLETYKKNQERIITLEEKKSTAEKSAVIWKTSAIWITILAGIASLSWYQISRINFNLTQNNSSLSEKYESTQNELFQTKLSLAQSQHDLDLIKAQQKNSNVTSNSVIPGKE